MEACRSSWCWIPSSCRFESTLVLSKLKIEVDNYPVWTDEITLETWPKGIDRLFALRDFLFLNNSGEVLARATTSWIIIDFTTRRPQKLDLVEPFRYSNIDRHAISAKPERLVLTSASNPWQHRVVHSDIDMNQHVNNIRYLDWMMDASNTEHHQKKKVEIIQIDFLQEVKPDEIIELHRQQSSPSEWDISGRNITSGKTSFNAKLIWKSNLQ